MNRMKIGPTLAALAAVAGSLVPAAAQAAAELPGAAMGAPWALPFLAVLLSIATGPLFFPKLWHHHYGKIVAGYAVATIVALAIAYGPGTSLAALVHAIVAEYLSFIVLLFALYTIAGGILVSGNVHGTPASNTAMLAIGTGLASLVGTTGAAMILIRPLLRANDERRHNAHVVIFFILLVANIGGSLTPLGDPPLFVGFLRGVDFFWTAEHLIVDTAFVVGILLALFFMLDTWFARRERAYLPQRDPTPPQPFGVQGLINLILIAGVIGAIMVSANWNPGISFDVFGTEVKLQNLVRDIVLVGLALLSVWLTHEEHRKANGFTWEPIKEVAKLFAAIFVTIIPVLAMLNAREEGAFAPLLDVVTGADGTPVPAAYFWLTGMLSAFLDNAPTYLVFFELAGGDAQELMGPLAETLAAISMGAVYMGALTYIGNAPNFMVYAIAMERGVRMPSFFGYLLWSCAVLLPIFGLLTLVALI
jgi:Na+/H+ antiporter NhaD/arsenite permease-like protein